MMGIGIANTLLVHPVRGRVFFVWVVREIGNSKKGELEVEWTTGVCPCHSDVNFGECEKLGYLLRFEKGITRVFGSGSGLRNSTRFTRVMSSCNIAICS